MEEVTYRRSSQMMPEIQRPVLNCRRPGGVVAALAILLLLSCTRNVYVVRHAEKATGADQPANMMTKDPPLSDAGKVRAIVLRDELKRQHIRHIYATPTLRATGTAMPLSDELHIPVDRYQNVDSLVTMVEKEKGNVLIVGHSNTVDDIVNGLLHEKKVIGDLKDAEYDNLFLVKLRGHHARFIRKKYGYPSNP
ncbi:MAG TPA: phosphoglycerate mutase family protein [Chitinophagaceae bacterium]|jgi:phosphohistidine phosphatase SixA